MSAFPPTAGLSSFESVARPGSVTRATSELHVTHSVISQRIKTLKQLTGVILFIRQENLTWQCTSVRKLSLDVISRQRINP